MDNRNQSMENIWALEHINNKLEYRDIYII
jgi:hypothetical protein